MKITDQIYTVKHLPINANNSNSIISVHFDKEGEAIKLYELLLAQDSRHNKDRCTMMSGQVPFKVYESFEEYESDKWNIERDTALNKLTKREKELLGLI